MACSGNCSFLEEPNYPRNLRIQVAGKQSVVSCEGQTHSASFTSYELYDQGQVPQALSFLVGKGVGEIRRPHPMRASEIPYEDLHECQS